MTFLGMFMLAIELGVASIRRVNLRPAPYLLVGVLPAQGLMVRIIRRRVMALADGST